MKPEHSVKLHYKHSGSGPVVIILHGLLGSLDNWQYLAKLLSTHYSVYCVDLRNHGKSPHTEEFTLSLMAGDVFQFIHQHKLEKPNIIGHSMGGKVALQMILENKIPLGKLFILDIAPKKYPRGHDAIFHALFALPLDSIKTRGEADLLMQELIPDFVTRQFVLKNLDRDKSGNFNWKANIDSIYRHYDEINREILFEEIINEKIIFIKGSLSNYILEDDEKKIRKFIPNAKFIVIEGAGHWIHADKPADLLSVIQSLL